jgi:hypothetical protein
MFNLTFCAVHNGHVAVNEIPKKSDPTHRSTNPSMAGSSWKPGGSRAQELDFWMNEPMPPQNTRRGTSRTRRWRPGGSSRPGGAVRPKPSKSPKVTKSGRARNKIRSGYQSRSWQEAKDLTARRSTKGQTKIKDQTGNLPFLTSPISRASFCCDTRGPNGARQDRLFNCSLDLRRPAIAAVATDTASIGLSAPQIAFVCSVEGFDLNSAASVAVDVAADRNTEIVVFKLKVRESVGHRISITAYKNGVLGGQVVITGPKVYLPPRNSHHAQGPAIDC